MPAKVWIDGAPIDAEAARVPVFDRGFLYGDSVYEVMRTFAGRPFALEEHLDRLERSAASLAMRLPERMEIVRAIERTCAAASEADLYVRVMVTRGAGEIALDPAAADAPRLVVIAKPAAPPPPEAYRDGVKVALVGQSRSGPGIVDPSVKSGNYLTSVLGIAEAKARGAYEAILCDAVGRVTEGSSSNFFLVRGRRVATPPLQLGLLEGITRRKVIELARSSAIPVDEQPLWPADFHRADEAFLTSSIRGVVPIVGVDEVCLKDGKPGAITRQLMALYERLTHG